LKSDSTVKTVDTPFDVPAEQARAMTSTDGHHAFAQVSLKDDYPSARRYYSQLRAEVQSDRLQVLGTGNVAIGSDFDKFLASDLQRAELVSLVIIIPLLLIVFATVVSMLLPLGVGGLAVVGGLAGVGVLAHFTDVSTYSTNIVTLIGLGVAIDYSLFIVNRFREELSGRSPPEQALIASMRTSGRAVTFSGITVAIGLSAMLFFQDSFLASMGFAGAIVVAIASDRVGELSDLAQRIKRVPGVAGIESLVSYDGSLTRADYQTLLTQPASAQPARVQAIVHGTTGARIAVLSVVTKHGQESDAARSIVHSLRAITPPAGSSMLVAAFSI